MSRIGKKPVQLPQGVTATVNGQTVTAKGPKGELKFVVNDEVLVKMENGEIAVEPRDQSKDARSKWGMSRTQIVNILNGVKDGFVAMSEGKINAIVECNPLLGPQLMEVVQTVKDGGTVDRWIKTKESDFMQDQAKDALPTRKY